MKIDRYESIVSACLILIASGCFQTTDARSVEGQTEEIIGGFPAESPALDAIGVIGSMSVTSAGPSGPISPICSGTLIDEDTVVTAKHCIRTFASLSAQNRTMVFGIGPQTTAPKQVVSVVAVEGAPGDTRGFTSNGHDVAVLHLDEPITSTKFAKPAAVSDDQIGQAFVGVGYGMRDNNGQGGARLVGMERLKATKGRTWEALLGSFDAYFESTYGIRPSDCAAGAAGGAPVAPPPGPGIVVIGPSDPCTQLSSARAKYDSELLETAHEIAMTTDEGDAQPCKGDSGGPLLQVDEAGELTTYGVVSGGKGSKTLICDYGTVYASFIAPEVLEFVEQAKNWTDPCAEVTVSGVCEGSVARRCSTVAEGDRRIVGFDCESLGLACAVKDPGGVGCF